MPPSPTPPTAPGSDPSIIEIIQNMVKEGESEDKILQTLSQLGVDPKKAQRLLLLGQADTFALLRSEISKIVKKDLEAEKKELNEFIQKESKAAVENARKGFGEQIKTDMRAYENEIDKQEKNFESGLDEKVGKYTDLAERIRLRVNQMGKDVQQIKIDQDELKLRGVGTQNRMVSFIMLGVGIIFVLAALGVFLFNFGAALTIESMIVFIVMSLVGVAALFISTLV